MCRKHMWRQVVLCSRTRLHLGWLVLRLVRSAWRGDPTSGYIASYLVFGGAGRNPSAGVAGLTPERRAGLTDAMLDELERHVSGLPLRHEVTVDQLDSMA